MSYFNMTPYYARKYVGWISPQGKFEMVDSYQHDAWAEDKLTELEVNLDERPQVYSRRATNSDWLMLLGWVHVTYDVIDDKLICFTRTKPPKATLDGLFDLYVVASSDERQPSTRLADSLLVAWKKLVDGETL